VLEVFYTVVNSRVDNILVKTAPDLNQPQFQFINALYVCMVKHVPEWLSSISDSQLRRAMSSLEVKNSAKENLASFNTAV